MQYINHALQPETAEDYELLATVDNIIGTINSYRYKTSIYTDGVGTTRPEYGMQLVARDGNEFELLSQGWNPLSK